MEREKIKLDVDVLERIVRGDSNLFDIIDHITTGTWRHGTEEETIVERLSDHKYFKLTWRDSVKDECDFNTMNYSGSYEEVFPVEKTITVYE